jgi:hypothetical protein
VEYSYLKIEPPYCAFTLHRYATFVFTNILQSPTLLNEMSFSLKISFLGYILT